MTSATLEKELSTILRSLEEDIGTTTLTKITLNVFSQAVKELRANTVEEFYTQLKELLTTFKNTEPRVGMVISYFSDLYDELEDFEDEVESVNCLRKKVDEIVVFLLKEISENDKRLVAFGSHCIENKDVILIHSHSKKVLETIKLGVEEGKKIKVVVAEQEPVKSAQLIAFLKDHEIPFFVVPEYMLSHVECDITKVFLGSVTLTKEFNFVAEPGTNSVVSELHGAKVPVYMFLSTPKFSLWKSRNKKHHTYKVIQKKIDLECRKPFSYDRIKFYYDRLPLDLVDYIVTEEGIFNSEEIQKVYRKKYRQYKEWREKHLEN